MVFVKMPAEMEKVDACHGERPARIGDFGRPADGSKTRTVPKSSLLDNPKPFIGRQWGT